jgi:GT2 family glycosyltransferase
MTSPEAACKTGNRSLAVVIPTYNRPDELQRCLSALEVQVVRMKDSGFEVDVVITDDGVISVETVSSLEWCRWVRGPIRGRAANRNFGAQQARGSWILFVDDDVIPQDGLLEAYSAAISGDLADVLEGRVVADRPKRAFNEICPLNLNGGALWSCNFAIRRTIFEFVHGFDDTYVRGGLEDTDLRLRLARHGATTIFLPDATVCHPWRRTNLAEVFTRLSNMEMFLDGHPDQAAVYNWQRFGRGVGHNIIVLVRDVVGYRGRGVGYQLGYAGIAAWMSLRLWRRS